MIERMYSIKETAKVLRKSTKTVRRYIQQGLLSVLKSGPRSVVVPESVLKGFMRPTVEEEERRVLKLLEQNAYRLNTTK